MSLYAFPSNITIFIYYGHLCILGTNNAWTQIIIIKNTQIYWHFIYTTTKKYTKSNTNKVLKLLALKHIHIGVLGKWSAVFARVKREVMFT